MPTNESNYEREITRRIILDTEQIRVNGQVKSFAEIWLGDKKLLEGNPDIKINWDGNVPAENDALGVLKARNEHWQMPTETITLNQTSLDKIIEILTSEVENSWQSKFHDKPKVEIVEPRRFLPRMNKLEREVNKQIGYGTLSTSIPQMASYPSEGVILIPSKFVAKVPVTPKYSRIKLQDVKKFNTVEFPWHMKYLEYVLYEALSIALYGQLRGEWKSEYVAAMKTLGPDFSKAINSMSSAFNQKRLEVTSNNEHNEWKLYAVSNKILKYLGYNPQMDFYIVADAVSQTRSIAQSAMIDIGILLPNQNDTVLVGIHSNHPNYIDKRRKFLNA